MLPYDLKGGQPTSTEYYKTISSFTDRWLDSAHTAIGDLVDDFQQYLRAHGKQPRSDAEHAFECLALGVLLREHGQQAAQLTGLPGRLLVRLTAIQERYPRAELFIKRLRGLIGGLAGMWQAVRGPIYVSPGDIRNLIRWLQALGENTQAERFAEWSAFFEDLPKDRERISVRRCWKLAEYFERESQRALGGYTAQVDPYRTGLLPRVHWRYDALLLSRSRVEYHLGMVGTEVLNRAYLSGFQATGRRLVIVPPCLRAQPDDVCQAEQTPMGAVCVGCTPTCRIHHITQLGKRHGIPVVSIPDDELGKLCVTSGQAGSGLGVVGVACALRNWSAGWESQKLGLNAQGLLLDYPGCKKHWDEHGIPTDTNLKQLEEMIRM